MACCSATTLDAQKHAVNRMLMAPCRAFFIGHPSIATLSEHHTYHAPAVAAIEAISALPVRNALTGRSGKLGYPVAFEAGLEAVRAGRAGREDQRGEPCVDPGTAIPTTRTWRVSMMSHRMRLCSTLRPRWLVRIAARSSSWGWIPGAGHRRSMSRTVR